MRRPRQGRGFGEFLKSPYLLGIGLFIFLYTSIGSFVYFELKNLLAEYDRVDTRLLAENLNVKEKEIIEMQMRLGSPDVSLDAPVGNEEGGTTRGMMLESDDTSAEELVSGLEIRRAFGEHLRDFAATLKERDLEIFNTRMLAEQPLTLQEIGNKYGISRERARQLEARILKNLRNFVKSKGIIDV